MAKGVGPEGVYRCQRTMQCFNWGASEMQAYKKANPGVVIPCAPPASPWNGKAVFTRGFPEASSKKK